MPFRVHPAPCLGWRVARGLGNTFNRLWVAAVAGNLGDGVCRVAIALLAARLTTDPVAFSALRALEFLPWLILGLPSGALVDRYDRRRLALLVGTVRAAAVAVLLTAVAVDRVSLWLLYVVVVVLGACETVYDNSLIAMLPAVVGDPRRLDTANGRFQGAELLAQSFVGPPLASALFAVVASAAFGVNVACYALAVLLLLALPGTYRAAEERRTPMVRAMGEAVRYVRHHPMHRVLLSVVVVLGFGNAMATALTVLWARETLGVPEAAFGLLILAGAVGAFVGSQSAAPIAARIGRGRTMVLSCIVTGLSMLLAAATRSPYLAGAAIAFTGWAILLWNVVYGSLRQRLTPDRLLGRTIGIYRVVAWGVMPLGALVGGAVAGVAGLRAPYLAGGALTLAAGGYALFRLTNARVEAAIAEADAALSVRSSGSP
jgi:MFS family permease